MIAVDTNLLIFAHRGDAPFHHEALAAENYGRLTGTFLLSRNSRCAIPW
jgi:predicted nucleic acid-binding protein